MKKVLYLIIAVVVVFLLYWLLNRPAVEAPAVDTTTAIQSELEGLNVGDLDKEFQSIDADLGQL